MGRWVGGKGGKGWDGCFGGRGRGWGEVQAVKAWSTGARSGQIEIGVLCVVPGLVGPDRAMHVDSSGDGAWWCIYLRLCRFYA